MKTQWTLLAVAAGAAAGVALLTGLPPAATIADQTAPPPEEAAPPSCCGDAADMAGCCGACCEEDPAQVAAAKAANERNFALRDQDGKLVRLSDFPDKYVVLEWVNWDCPFIQAHLKAHTTSRLVKKYEGKPVVFLAVNSTKGQDAARDKTVHDGEHLAYPVLDDHAGVVGRLYGAKTTPHVFLLGLDRKELYSGAYDDNPLGKKPATNNYLEQALDEVLAGRSVSAPTATPYGCGVKYAPAPKMAPAFTLNDSAGNPVSLSDYRGQFVVLEWTNWRCPFVVAHEKAGTTKQLAAKYKPQGVVWLKVNSSHFADAAQNLAEAAKCDDPTPVLVDQDGKVGRLYEAKTTPHLFLVDPNGVVLYEGAYDDNPLGQKPETVCYIANALDEALAGKPVGVPQTVPYGCSVKYAK